MITKTQILELAKEYELLPNTVQKDYVIGWLLRAISEHGSMSNWVFKGGTCLKKCYFETYRFSEDLDFTIPSALDITSDSITGYLDNISEWIESRSGLKFPRDYQNIESYTNLRGNISFRAKISYKGPLGGHDKSLPRVKFDITQDEIIVDEPELRELHHGFSDVFSPIPTVRCYSINEVLAEKTRALFERNGRARDVYDVVNISRNFRSEIDSESTRRIMLEKFKFKGLAEPTVSKIIDAIDVEVLRANWDHQLAHQIPVLPPVASYIDELQDAIAWWFAPSTASPALQVVPGAGGVASPRENFSTFGLQQSRSILDTIRQAARNRLCVELTYHGHTRLVEPYSVRYPATGNQILHVWEKLKDGYTSEKQKSFIIPEITSASISNATFVPKWLVEF